MANSERAMYPSVLKWAAESGARNVGEEVRTHGRSRADLVITFSTRRLAAVELKVKDWRRAGHQALLNRYCTHESYVAIWWKHASSDCEEYCRKHGLGLLSVEDNDCYVIVRPERSSPYSVLVKRIQEQLVDGT